MSGFKKLWIPIALLVTVSGATVLGELLSVQGVPSLVSTAKAEVGRPLTPVSVAGVARRSARR
ncbi:hypothetical protein AB4144_02055 [Rhizobiaceae sp. 2RAB30]